MVADKSPSFRGNSLLLFHIFAFTVAFQTSVLRFATFVTPLAPPSKQRSSSSSAAGAVTNRRNVLSSIVSRSKECTAIGILATVTTASTARAAIDVSGLRVENPTATDIFLGGTYYADDDADREGVDGRISRMKYTIELVTSSEDFIGLYRSIKVKGMSSAISSSRDDYVEFSGTIFQCSSVDGGRQGGACIRIDFSPLGGPKDATGYWDENEKGIRFIRNKKVW
eukprot:CAMPEP_0201194056 /NCGR_PEP_ID=MMETSP0851-20130426/148319_1 /ASSEMBLY_ACC=CAM_ASM_000631 /TAXON_ID=183588 /ORGANISM="Pseudo-nitzschia fraudulenta, Strain WWA7" /LENGTH=224 /DNA_ID=CAMNT_0047480665 /DNA_START=112 /DNA_END=783 /DNA_ORIENTATION=-